jgi:putative copper export protein
VAVAAANGFRVVVNTCIAVLVSTGMILALDRLTKGVVGAPYVVTLGVKVALSVWMFMLVRAQRRQSAIMDVYREHPRPAKTAQGRAAEALSSYNALVVIGVVVLLLSDLLKVLFEIALARGP